MLDNPPLHWTAAAERLPLFGWSSARPRPVNGIPLYRPMRNGSLTFVALIAGCVAVGCDTGTEPTQASTQPTAAATQPAAAVAQPRYGWYQTRGDASQVLVTKLSIPGVFEAKTDEIRIARYVRIDADGLMQLPPEMYFGMSNADGRNEKVGFGYGGAIDVIEDEEHDDAVVLDVSYYWTTSDQVRGQLAEKVPAKIGAPLDVQLPGGCRLQVSWRALSPP